MIPVILPADAVRLRAFLSGCYPIPMIFGGPAIVLSKLPCIGHDFISDDVSDEDEKEAANEE